MDWKTEFPGLGRVTYLNSCAHGLLPLRARRAMEAHFDVWEADPEWDAWAAAIDEARRAFARLIGASPEEVSIQANATSGLASIMSAYPSGRISTIDIDFPTSGFLAERQVSRGMKHDRLSLGLAPTAEEWARRAGGATLACLPYVASFSGYKLDVREFVARAHAKGTAVVVDAFQAAGSFPIDVKRDDVDFLVSGVYKWLLGPAGLAFLYVRKDHHDLVPRTSGWYAAREPYSFDITAPLAEDARRFEYGGPSIVGCVGATASLELLHEVGLANVGRSNTRLVERIVEMARERKFEVVTPEARGSIVTFRVPDLARALDACAREGVVVNSRLGGIRVSPHFYNDVADVDRLFAVLDSV